MRRIKIIYIFLCLSLWSCPVMAEKPVFHFRALALIWIAPYDGHDQVYYSQFRKGEWSIPLQVSHTKSFVFNVAGAIAGNGDVLLVWAEESKKGTFLYSSVCKKNHWSKPVRIITGMNDSRDPVMVVDGKGVIWLAWTGVDGSYSDIFWARRLGSGWSEARKVHGDNKVPDVDPVFSIDADGVVALSWQTFSDGNPLAVSMVWNGKAWVGRSLQQRTQDLKNTEKRRKFLPRLPGFVFDMSRATFLFQDKNGSGILPVTLDELK